MNTAVIFGLALVVLLAAPAIWWAVSALRRRNRAVEADPPAPDPLAALTVSLNEGLAGMRTEMGDLLNKLTEQGGRTQQQLEDVAESNTALTNTANQLQNLLADGQSRGYWGERMAEDAIRAAGLEEGINFRKQARIANGAVPDFTFLLPEGKKLHMDVKFPLDNYRRYAEAQSEAERNQFLKKFMSDVGGHIKTLAARGYADADDGLGFTLLFIPVESVWGAILQQDQPLMPHTETRRVALCSPTTLFPILMMIRNIMDSFQMVAHGQEIVKAVAEFELEWEKYGAAADKVDKHLNTLVNSLGALTSTRTNVLQRKMTAVSDLRTDPPPPQALPRPADRQDPPVAANAA